MRKNILAKKIVFYEWIGFGTVILFLWLDELLDLPHKVFNAEMTPVNWLESLVESIFVLALCLFVTSFTRRFLKKIKYLEGFLPVCAVCKRIRVGENWIPIDEYVGEHSDAEFSHSFCPECLKKYYGKSDRNSGESLD